MAYVIDAPDSTLGTAAVPAVYSTNDFTPAANWSGQRGGAGSFDPIVTPNAGRAPDGTMTATRIQFNRGPSAGAYALVQQNGIPITDGTAYTESVFIMRTPGGPAASVGLRLAFPAQFEYNKTVTPTTRWARYSATAQTSKGGILQPQILTWDAAHIAPPQSPAADILVWGFRIDAGLDPLGMDYSAGDGSAGIGKALALAALGWLLFG